jgi:hypothetical protein
VVRSARARASVRPQRCSSFRRARAINPVRAHNERRAGDYVTRRYITSEAGAEAITNPFKEMLEQIPDVERRANGDRAMCEFTFAAALLELSYGTDWYQRKIKLRAKPDEWMHNLQGDQSEGRILYHHRVVRLGNAVFTLLQAKTKGWDTLKGRFQKRATKPCFVEAEIASMLVYNGFDVEIKNEVGIRGEDFDMAATKDGVTLEVEVTTKEPGPLTVNTIKNTIKGKRTQVSGNHPAVLYIRIPSEWMEDGHAALQMFTEAFLDFWSRSTRFNALVLVWEEVKLFGSGGRVQMKMQACYVNPPSHAHPFLNLITPVEDSLGRSLLANSFYDFLKSKQTI